SAGAALQLDPGAEEETVGLGQAGGVVVEEDAAGGLRPMEGVDVAQPAPAGLEVGLERERHLARPLVTGVDAGPELGEPLLRLPLPPVAGALGQLGREGGVAGDVPGAEQGGGGVE